jgi:FkbM family methyltransferase
MTFLWNEQNVRTSFNAWFAANGDYTHAMNFNLGKFSDIILIGGHTGDTARLYRDKFNCFLEIYEPVPQFYVALKNRFTKFELDEEVMVYNEGVSDSCRDDVIFVDGVSTSLYIPNRNETQIKLVDIETVLSRASAIYGETDHLHDMLFINIEGEEYRLLDDIINKDLQTKFKNIQIQFHVFADPTNERRNKIRANLSRTHKITFDFPYVWENWELK